MNKIVHFAVEDAVISAVRFDGASDETFAGILHDLGVKRFAVNCQFFDDPILVIVTDDDIQLARNGDYVMRSADGRIWTETAEQIETHYKLMEEP